MAANAVLGGVREAGAVLGPLLGGVIVAAGGVRAGLTVDGLTFLVSVPLLARAPRLPPSPRRQRSRLAADAWAGLRYTLADPVTRALAVGFFLAGLAAADDVALPFLARTLDAGAPGIGELYAALGAGLILGYVALNRRNSRLTPIAGILLGSAVAATGNLLTGPPRQSRPPSRFRPSAASASRSTRRLCRRRCSGRSRASCWAGCSPTSTAP